MSYSTTTVALNIYNGYRLHCDITLETMQPYFTHSIQSIQSIHVMNQSALFYPNVCS